MRAAIEFQPNCITPPIQVYFINKVLVSNNYDIRSHKQVLKIMKQFRFDNRSIFVNLTSAFMYVNKAEGLCQRNLRIYLGIVKTCQAS